MINIRFQTVSQIKRANDAWCEQRFARGNFFSNYELVDEQGETFGFATGGISRRDVAVVIEAMK